MVDQTQEIHRNDDWQLAIKTPNISDEIRLPLDMTFNEGHIVSIVTYSILMVIAAVGNITVLVILRRRRRNIRSRLNTMLMHLAIADLMVTFLLMPLEIGWASTVSWRAGDAMCRIMAFFRTFGLYLSSFILICICVDRYYAILKPLSLGQFDRLCKIMLAVAWTASTVCSMPQILIFHVENHPNFTYYEQCVIFHSFPNHFWELLYKYFGFVMMYLLPLVVILFTYTSILWKIYKKFRDSQDDTNWFRRSNVGFFGKAKIRTLKMTIIIVVVFIVCWTPYYVICIWYWIDSKSAELVDQRIQKGLFLFASANSCMNPIVYGAFNIRSKGTKARPSAQTISRDSGTKLTSLSLSIASLP
ncbi:UNVERIFIED_CONTAM: hypothetical protein PYX00_000228 [Menopon gallinae]|uniref:G-protein coupled receptors family 1 profile domain-containing protein n=1 Tax=Menopon gallinae TaxID=328185 RepID=A0AAW2I7Q2_9NEOP